MSSKPNNPCPVCSTTAMDYVSGDENCDRYWCSNCGALGEVGGRGHPTVFKPAYYGRLAEVVKELLPFARRDVRRLNETMVGSLYPSINEAMIERAEQLLKTLKGGGK